MDNYQFINKIFFKVLNNIPHNIFLKNAKDLKFEFVNLSLTKMMGIDSESIIGKSDFDFFPKEQAQKFIEADKEVLKSKKLKVVEEEMNTPSGKIWIRTKKVPLLDENGEPSHLLGVSENITELKKTQDKITETNNFFLSVLDNMPVTVMLKDAKNLNFTYVNKLFYQMSNIKEGALIGKNGSEFWPEQNEQFEKDDRKVLNNEKQLNVEEEELSTKNGKIWLRTKKVVIKNYEGNATHLLAVSEDITEQKKINEILLKTKEEISQTNALFQSVLDNMPIIVFLKDSKNLSFSFINKTFEKMHNMSQKEVLGKSDFDFFPQEQAQQFNDDDRSVLETNKLKSIPEEPLDTPDGSTLWLRTKKIPISNAKGKTTYLLGMSEDITEEKKIADELQQRNKELRQARIDAENANQAKSTFLANMSHELRTPLNAIIGYSEMLMEDAEDENEGFIPDLEKISSSGKHLLGLINDILDLSKVESGKMELFIEEYNPNDIIKEIQSTIIPLIEKNNNTLKITNDVSNALHKADVTKIRQIMFNLLSNASKFTKEGNIYLKVTSKDDLIIFSVKDTGIGMTNEQVNKVFKPFTQAQEDTTRKFGGTGLGLTITKMFAEMMGGNIKVSSVFKKGTTFEVSLPKVVIDLKEKTIKKSNQTEIFEDSKYKVLVIDDDPNSQDMMRRILSKQDYGIFQATSGKEGLELAEKYVPDLITLDVIMPGMDGWEVLAQLKENEKTKNIPVIMLSLVDDPDLGFSLGATDYLTKPVNWNKLSDILKKHQILSDSHSVLIVEDDEVTSEMLKKNLEKNNFKVKTATNGKKGLEVVKNSKPGLILLDLMMPEMDGFEFAEQLRENKDWIDIPIVVITAKDLSKEDHSRLKGNVETIMQKGSYSKDQLLSEVSEHIRKIRVKGEDEKNTNS